MIYMFLLQCVFPEYNFSKHADKMRYAFRINSRQIVYGKEEYQTQPNRLVHATVGSCMIHNLECARIKISSVTQL